MQGTISYQYMSLGVYTGMHSFPNNYIRIERLQNKSNEKLFYQLAFLHGQCYFNNEGYVAECSSQLVHVKQKLERNLFI